MAGEVRRLSFLEGVIVSAPTGYTPEWARANVVSLTIGETEKTIVFSSPWANASYIPSVEILCDDVNSNFPSYIIQNRTINGFTVKLNSPVDSNNYKIAYRITEAQ